MKIHAISQTLPQARYQRCPQCDTLFSLPDVKSYQSAHCPRCNAQIVSGRDWSMTRLLAMAATMLVLMPFAFSMPLIDIRLLGMRIDASVLEGIVQMTLQGNVLTASMVAFCTIGAPVTLVAGIGYLALGERLGMNLRPVLLMLDKLKEWVMLDIFDWHRRRLHKSPGLRRPRIRLWAGRLCGANRAERHYVDSSEHGAALGALLSPVAPGDAA